MNLHSLLSDQIFTLEAISFTLFPTPTSCPIPDDCRVYLMPMIHHCYSFRSRGPGNGLSPRNTTGKMRRLSLDSLAKRCALQSRIPRNLSTKGSIRHQSTVRTMGLVSVKRSAPLPINTRRASSPKSQTLQYPDRGISSAVPSNLLSAESTAGRYSLCGILYEADLRGSRSSAQKSIRQELASRTPCA